MIIIIIIEVYLHNTFLVQSITTCLWFHCLHFGVKVPEFVRTHASYYTCVRASPVITVRGLQTVDPKPDMTVTPAVGSALT